MSRHLLINEPPLLVLPALAVEVGLNEAVFLQQIHFWMVKFKDDEYHHHEGRTWVWNTYEEWQENFPFWSTRTIKRIVTSLRSKGVLIVGTFNKKGYDKTNWYTIDYGQLVSLPSCQLVTMDSDKLALPIPETTTERTSSSSEEKDIIMRSTDAFFKMGAGIAGPTQAELIGEMVGEYGIGAFEAACQQAAKYGAKNLAYVHAILQSPPKFGAPQKNYEYQLPEESGDM